MLDELDFKTLTLDQHGDLAILTLNRPQALNALSGELLIELVEAVEAVAETAEVAALIITGNERAFVAGADITELARLEGVYSGREASLGGQNVMHEIASLPFPTIAAIDGYALGGGLELALACDVRVASPGAKLGFPEVTLGLLPGYGGTQRLSRLIGPGRALDLMLTGRQVGAEEALQMGLINYLAPNALEKAREVAQMMTANAPIALSLIKEAVRRGLTGSLEEGLEIEADLFGMAVSTQDFKEGTAAFLAKRKPKFQGE
jgi:enoyl-CoA hydratase